MNKYFILSIIILLHYFPTIPSYSNCYIQTSGQKSSLDNRESKYEPGDRDSLTYKDSRITVEVINGDYVESTIFVLDCAEDEVVLPYQVITYNTINLPDYDKVYESADQNGNPDDFLHAETKLRLKKIGYYQRYMFIDPYNPEKLIAPGSSYKYPVSASTFFALCRILNTTSTFSCCSSHNNRIPSISAPKLSAESLDRSNSPSNRPNSSSDLSQNDSSSGHNVNNNSFAFSNEMVHSLSTSLFSALSSTSLSNGLVQSNSSKKSCVERLEERTIGNKFLPPKNKRS